MFHRHRLIDSIISLVFITTVASCDLGAGCGCGVDPLPPGGLPADQTIEGGAQIRVTQAGFSKITSIIPAVINDALGSGFCIPRNNVVDAGIAEAELCGSNAGGCSPGCPVTLSLDPAPATNISADGQNLNIQLQFDAHADVRIDWEVFWVISGVCNADFDLNNGFVDIDVGLGIDPATGELTIEPADINTLDITGISVSGDCGGLDAIVDAALNLFAGLLNSFLGDLILDLVRPLINDLLQGLLPDPLGIEGLIDAGSLIGAVSPGTNASLEMRAVPGGFVDIVGNGMTLGVILGANADEDVSTRSPELDNEPAFCVPPVQAPDFSGMLPTSERNTFILAAADEFRGSPEPDADLAIGLSETTLDLLGHHAFSSGTLCLGIGPGLVPQLNLGLIGILVPSFAELGSDDGSDPLLLVTRPVKALDFTIGEGTEESPAITLHIQEFEIDFYAFIFERYVRGFTVRLGMDVGVNLEFTTDGSGAPAILPVLTGLDTNSIEVAALNSEFLRETDEELAATLPSVLELALPLITDSLGAIALPDFAGFTLSDLQTARVVTSEDEFLAITASLGSVAPFMAQLADQYPSVREIVGEPELQPLRAITKAQLRDVQVPTPDVLREGLMKRPGGAMPQVVIDVEPTDSLGRQLEWAWNIDGGMWRSFTRETPLVIDTPALAFQGEYTIEVAARVVGDYRTMDLTPVEIPVVIDSVGPTIHIADARLVETGISIPVSDLVTPVDAIEMAYGHPDDAAPATEWGILPLSVDDARALASADGQVAVYARDKNGNVSKSLIDIVKWLPFHGTGGGGGGCACAAGSTDNASLGGMALLFLLTFIALAARGRRRRLRRPELSGHRSVRGLVLSAGLVLGMGAFPACDCGGAAPAICSEPGCISDEECDVCCDEGFLGVCLTGTCLCQAEPPWGKFGQYSDMALGPSGAAWVSGYNSYYGDLVVARFEGTGEIPEEVWEFVDGVPSGPVVAPRSQRRGGIEADGEDVGKYTSIVVNQLDEVMVSHFDTDQASLKLTTSFGGTWQSHVVSAGRPGSDPELGFEVVGQYSSITVDPSTGYPGIAYFAHISENAEVRTEVRYVSANTATPASAGDWGTPVVVDMVVVPDEPNPLAIPQGVGLFIDSARQTDGTPAMVYYDRLNGDLKLARYNLNDGVFDPPAILAGDDGTDVGWYPSLAIDGNNDVHVSFVDATSDDLKYMNTIDMTPELVDDGYRLVGTTEDGLPKPEFHLVGDDSSIVLTTLGPVIVYQDATSHELLRSFKNGSGLWQFTKVAGNEADFAGGYGFYASAAYNGRDVVISSWVVNQPEARVWVEVFREFLVVE